MDVAYNPAQTGNVVAAPEYNANMAAFQAALDAMEGKISGVISDMHGEGVLRGLQLIDGGNFITITPGVAYSEGIRLLLSTAYNVALPPYSVCRAWVLDSDDTPAIVNVPAERVNYPDNSSSVVYDGDTERTAVSGALQGYVTKLTDGTATILYSGKGPMHLMLSRDSAGGSATIQTRTQNADGSWGAWSTGTAETSVSFYSSIAQKRRAICIGAPDSAGATKQIRITATGDAYIEGFYYLDPEAESDARPSTYAVALAWVYTGAGGDILEVVDTRTNIVLSNYWLKLIETMYKLLATQVVCTDFWFDGFGSLVNVGLGSTCNVDTGAHQADMGALPPYPVATCGQYTIPGRGTSVTETIALSRTAVQLTYPRLQGGSVVVKNATGITTYATGYIVDTAAGTIAWDPDADPQPITENETVRVTYTGISTLVLTAREPGDRKVLVEVSEGSTADADEASLSWLRQNGIQGYIFTPKAGIVGRDGNGLKVTVEHGTNNRSTLAELQLNDRAVPPTHSMELKSAVLGTEGNFVRAKISNDTGQRLQEEGFETVSPASWVLQANSKGTVAVATDQKRAGIYSLKFHKTSDGSRMRGYQLFDAKQNFEYQVTLYFASSACTSDINGTARILSADRATEVASSQFLSGANRNNLTFASATFTFVCPSTMNRLALALDIDDGTGDVWVDDCSITVVTPDSFKLEVEDGHLYPFFSPLTLTGEELSASSSESDADHVLDGDKTTYWQGGENTSWLAADFATAPQAITGVSIFVPQNVLDAAVDVELETKDGTGVYTSVRTSTIKAGWCALKLPGEVDAYGVRLTTAAPIAILRVHTDTAGSNPQPRDGALNDSLLLGGGFEAWETRSGKQQPMTWTRKVAGVLADGAYSTQASVVLAGSRSAEDASVTDNIGTYESDTISLAVGKDYTAFVMARASGLTAAEVSASIVPMDGETEGTPIPLVTEAGASSITADCEWTLLAVRFTATTTTAKMLLKRDGVGTVHWDGAELFLVGETYRNLTLDAQDPAIGWEVPYTKAENAVNSGDTKSELVSLVNLTGATGFPDDDTDMNPAAVDFCYLSGGGTQYITTKLTIQRYAVGLDGVPTGTLISSEEFDNLTVAANDVPGGFTPVNEDLETVIDQQSALVNVQVTPKTATATYLDNPVVGSSFLTGGATDYDTVNLDIYATSSVTQEAEDLLGFNMGGADFYATDVDFNSQTNDTGAHDGAYVSGSGTFYLHITEALAKLYLVYYSDAAFGTLQLAIAEYDSDGVLGAFSSAHAALLVSSVDQSAGAGQQQEVAIAQRMVETYNNGDPKHYVLRLTPASGTCNIDAFRFLVVAHHETFTDLSVRPAVFSQSGKSPLLTVINSGYGSQGPSSIIGAAGANSNSNYDNPTLGGYWLEGESGTTQVLYGPILDSSPLAYWDALVLYADTLIPEGTSITFQYSLNPLNDTPVWAPLTAGAYNALNGEVGDNKLQLRAVLATEVAGQTPVLYNWGVFWGSPSYTPEGARTVVLEGDAYIMSTSSTVASSSAGGFHASSTEVVEGSGIINIPVACRPSRVALSIESVYVGPYHSWGEHYAQQVTNPYDPYYGEYGYWDNYGYTGAYGYGYYGYDWPADYFGWQSVEVENLDGQAATINGSPVEIYVGGQSSNQFSIFWRFPVGWQVKVHYVCEGWR